jgi:predicted phage baseplate assembly protein
MTLPLDNLDDKSFEDLVKEAISRIPVYAPEWTAHNRSDPGITFIELLSWLMEMQIYRLNRIDDKTYLKFLKLLGIDKLKPATPAQVDVTFSIKDKSLGSRPVPIGTKVAASVPAEGEDVIFETVDYLDVLNISLEKVLSSEDGKTDRNNIECLRDNTAANANENIYYHAFGQNPVKNAALYLGFRVMDELRGKIKEKILAMMVYLKKEPPRPEGDLEFKSYSSADLKWQYYSGLSKSWMELKLQDKTDNLTNSGLIKVTLPDKISVLLPDDMKAELPENEDTSSYNLFWIRCSVAGESWEIPPVINRIALNTVHAVHGSKTEARYSASGLPDLMLTLGKPPVRISGNGIIKIAVSSNAKETEWTEVEDFDSSGPGDQSYVLDSANGTVTFGDGINGALPPRGDKNILITYLSGAGPAGNVGAHSINRIMDNSFDTDSGDTKLSDAVTVENQIPASGGKSAETLEEAIGRARKELRSITRAVTASDYEYLAMNTPGISIKRAKALPLYHPLHKNAVFNTITVIVVPDNGSARPDIESGDSFLRTVHSFLDNYRLLATDLFVIPPEYIRVMVKSTVVCKEGVDTDKLMGVIIKRLNKFLHPIEGGSMGSGWPFGRPVYLSEIYETISRVEGVDFVNDVQLRKDDDEWKAANAYIPKHGLVYSGQDEGQVPKDLNYLFNWSEIPGKDSESFIGFLTQEYDLDWVKTAKFEKTDDDKAIKASTENNHLSLKIDDKKTEAELEVNNCEIDKYIVKKENGKLNIYDRYIHEIKIVKAGNEVI